MKIEEASFGIKIKRSIHQLILRRKIKRQSFTLISQNCVGGVIYNMLKMPFLSPTINLFIEEILKYEDSTEEEKDYSIIGEFTPPEATGKCVYCNHCEPCPVGLDIGLINKTK